MILFQKKYFFPVVLLFAFLDGKAQDPSKIISFHRDYEAAKTDSARVEALRDLCFNFSLLNPDSSIYYGTKGLKLALKTNFIKGTGDCYNSLGWCYTKKGDYSKARENLILAKKYFEQTGNQCYVSVALANIGNLYYFQNLMAEALDHFLVSEKINENCPDEGFKSSGIYSIGIIYNSQKEYDKAIGWFRKANEINAANRDTGKMAECINGIGNSFLGLKMYDSALVYFDKSSAIFENTNNLNGVAFANESMGTVFLEQKKYARALEHFEIALQNFRVIGSKADICYELMTIGDAYQQMEEILLAIKYQQQALQIAGENKFMNLEQEALTSLSELFALNKDHKNAYEYFRKASVIKDSIALQDQQVKLDELKTKYETEQKDKEIMLLNKDKELQHAEARKQKQLKNIFIGGIGLLLLFVFVLINRYLFKQRTAKELEEKNKLIEIEKARAQKSEKFRQQFLANMSHEIRTPMNAISGMSELVLETSLSEEQNHYLQSIKNSCDNLLVIINDILDLSKLEAGKMQLENRVFNLNEQMAFIYETFRHKAEEKKLEFKLVIDKDIPVLVKGDAARINQVLINLVGNAIKFTEKGKVSLKVQKVKSPTVNEPDDTSGQTVEPLNSEHLNFKIEDTGIGIPADKLNTIFESFTQANVSDTRKYGGTGLGLTIAENLIELFGSKLNVESEVDKGSVFSFTVNLDSYHQPADNILPAETIQETALAIENISETTPIQFFIAEDNPYNQLLITGILRKKIKNAELQVCNNGIELIEKLKSSPGNFMQSRCMILMDMQMPVMDGLNAATIIRNELESPANRIPIIGLTAGVVNNEREKCFAAGMNGFLTKPYTIQGLLSEINRVMDISDNLIEQPLPRQAVNEIKKNQQLISENFNLINLSYLDDFTEGDEAELKKYLHVFAASAKDKLNELQECFSKQDWNGVLQVMHSIKTLLMSVGVPRAEATITETEKFIWLKQYNKALPLMLDIKQKLQKAIDEIYQLDKTTA